MTKQCDRCIYGNMARWPRYCTVCGISELKKFKEIEHVKEQQNKKWRQISTAPIDGTPILVRGDAKARYFCTHERHWVMKMYPNQVGEGHYSGGSWQFRGGTITPNGWMPLPDA